MTSPYPHSPNAADRFLRALVRLVLKIFFREVEVAGA